jgi:hypothetical protein
MQSGEASPQTFTQFKLFSSIDGSTWTERDARNVVWATNETFKDFFLTTATTDNYWRIVANVVGNPSSSSRQLAQVQELAFYTVTTASESMIELGSIIELKCPNIELTGSTVTQDLTPDTTLSRVIGDPTLQYLNVYSETVNTTSLPLPVSTNKLVPAVDISYDLGQPQNRYREAFINQLDTSEIVCTNGIAGSEILFIRASTINTFGDLRTRKVLPTTVGYDIGEPLIPYQNIYTDGTIYCDLLDAKKIKKTWASVWCNNSSRNTKPGALGNYACVSVNNNDVNWSSSDIDIIVGLAVPALDGSEGVSPKFFHQNPNIPEMEYCVSASIVFKSNLASFTETVIAFFKNGVVENSTDSTGIIPASAVQITNNSSVGEQKTASFNFIVSLKFGDNLVMKMGNFNNPANELNVTFLKWTISQI